MSAIVPGREARESRRPALERASKIRDGMRTYIDTLGLIHTAWAERDDIRLGYPSWEAYYNGEFSEERVRLSPEMRDKAIRELRIAGMSQRQIATSTGLSAATVNRHLAGVAGETDILEGELLPPARSPLVEAMTGAIEDAEERAQNHREPAPGEADAPASAGTDVLEDQPSPSVADVADNPSAGPGPDLPPAGSGPPNLPDSWGEDESGSGVTSPIPDPDRCPLCGR